MNAPQADTRKSLQQDTRKDSEIIRVAVRNIQNARNYYSCNAIWWETISPLLGTSDEDPRRAEYRERSERLQREFKEYASAGGSLPYYWDRSTTLSSDHEAIQADRAAMLEMFAMSLEREGK